MRVLIIILILCINGIYAQEWKKYHRNDLGLQNLSLVESDYFRGSRHFRINPYDNSLWMGRAFMIQSISSEGEPSYFFSTNTSVFNSACQWATFEFLPDKVLALDEYFGLFTYENGIWFNPYSSGFSSHITMYQDTLYILRTNNPIAKWPNDGNIQYGFNAGDRKRITIRNDHFWLANGFGYTGLYLHDKLGNTISYDNSLRMDNDNFDFKFSPHYDTLYVAGNKGLSLLHNLTFFDSIAPDNTTNMPLGVILDFEFDANDNIWALFGSDAQTPTSVAHYDQQTKNWDMYYDAVNSDLNFSSYCSIEMDTFGNVWMVNRSYIHVLDLGSLPVWLSSKQPSFQPGITVYPNPVTSVFQIDTDTHILEIYLKDQLGKRIKALDPNQKEFSVSGLSPGIYFVELTGEGGTKSIVKLIKN